MENKYHEYIMVMLRKRRGLDGHDSSEDSQINEYTSNEAFEEVLDWNGLIGWDTQIKEYVLDIYGIDLDEGV